jgi:acyl-coenzyme A synthetase/AMP-(fatty) acid ligase
VIYKTGDIGRYLRDGSIECLGRRDDQVKINGVRIELAEVETALREIPGVTAAASAIQPQSDGERALVGYYVRADGSSEPLAEEMLRMHLGRILPPSMQPHHLMPIAELPTVVSGKVNRKALPRPEALFHS